MELTRLLELLDIEEASEFKYFDNFSELMEMDEELAEDIIYVLFSQVDRENLCELIGEYFEDIFTGVPDDAADIYSLFEMVKTSFIGLLKSPEEDALRSFSLELSKFRSWYTNTSRVYCKSLSTHEEKIVTVRDAIMLERLSKLGEEEYSFSFEDALDYELEEYIMSFSDLIESTEEEFDEDEEGETL